MIFLKEIRARKSFYGIISMKVLYRVTHYQVFGSVEVQLQSVIDIFQNAEVSIFMVLKKYDILQKFY